MDISNDNNQKKGKRSAARWPFFLIAISGVLLLTGGVQLLSYYSSYQEETALNDKLQQIRTDIAGTSDERVMGDVTANSLAPLEQSADLRKAMTEINPEYIGWLDVEDTLISYPVVWRDNEYYIDHDFEGRKNRHGAIFFDETCNKDSLIWLIHGHHMKDGTMFAGLGEYKNKEYLKNHTELTLDVGEGAQTYGIYAAALIDFTQETELTPAFHYEKLPGTMEEFTRWHNNLRKNAYWYDEEKAPELMDRQTGELPEVLVLSTCEYGTEVQRLIVVAVKIAAE